MKNIKVKRICAYFIDIFIVSLLATGIGMMGLTIGTVTLTTAELAIIAGFGLGVIGVVKGFNVSFKPTGEVLIEKK